MDNATDALKMAFAVFIFVIALTLSISMFSQLNQVSKVVLASSDITTFYNYQISQNQTRVVGLETIIPTLYKYYKENYTVLFLERNGKPLKLYETQTDSDLWGSGLDENGNQPHKENIAKYYEKRVTKFNYEAHKNVCAFDVDEETVRHEPWTGSHIDFKTNLDKFLNGEIFYYPSGATNEDGSPKRYSYDGFIKNYSNKKFKEMLGEYTYDLEVEEENDENSQIGENALLKKRKKRVIIYQLQ